MVAAVRAVESSGGLPERRWLGLQAAWPHIVEPIGLEESTTPCLVGASSPTSAKYLNGELIEERRAEALALARLPAGLPLQAPMQNGLPQPHLAWVLMRGTDTLAAFGSQISALPPVIAASDCGPGWVRLTITGRSLGATATTTVRGDAYGWISAAVPIPEDLLDGPVALVIFGAQWAVPDAMTMRVSTDLNSYFDGFGTWLA